MKNKLTCVAFGAVIAAFSLMCILLPKSDFSESERRVLAAFPDFAVDKLLSGEFSVGFEEYATDTFPYRDAFRAIKAFSSEHIFNMSDNNKLFSDKGHLSKLDYPISTNMLDHAAERFENIYNTYLAESSARVYLSIIPDKNFFLDTLNYDFNELVTYMRKKTPFMQYIDISSNLSLDDYYFTDSHWRQENLTDVADTIAAAMGAGIAADYYINELEAPFYGVYVGQSAKKVKPDTIKFLTNDILDNCIVTSYDTGVAEPAFMYDLEKADGRDPYEMFLSGNSSLITIENTAASEARELIVFRDSFASSLVPLLVPGYSKVTLVDIRYIRSDMLGGFVNFDNTDVLFLYSSSMLNNSSGLK